MAAASEGPGAATPGLASLWGHRSGNDGDCPHSHASGAAGRVGLSGTSWYLETFQGLGVGRLEGAVGGWVRWGLWGGWKELWGVGFGGGGWG